MLRFLKRFPKNLEEIKGNFYSKCLYFMTKTEFTFDFGRKWPIFPPLFYIAKIVITTLAPDPDEGQVRLAPEDAAAGNRVPGERRRRLEVRESSGAQVPMI
jgi:hypothetical protein